MVSVVLGVKTWNVCPPSYQNPKLHALQHFSSCLQDGRIDYGEFAAMMRKGDGGMGRNRTMRNTLNFNLADAFGVKDPSAAS